MDPPAFRSLRVRAMVLLPRTRQGHRAYRSSVPNGVGICTLWSASALGVTLHPCSGGAGWAEGDEVVIPRKSFTRTASRLQAVPSLCSDSCVQNGSGLV